MKIKKIKINKFKRFTNLEIKEIPKKTKLVIMVGPNGSGKSSVFEAFNHWYKLHGYGKAIANEKEYYEKKSDIVDGKYWYQNKVDIDFHEVVDKGENLKGKFYFRTAYRNQPDFTISRLESQKNPTEEIKLSTLMMNDVTVSENYQRLIAQTLEGVYKEENNSKDIKTFREELVGKIQESLSNIFDDLNLNSIGNPLSNGSFYFKKGNVVDFHYKNLSSGEKSVFDLILDLIIKLNFYDGALICIDEPEAHMHTKLQSKVLKELYRLTPETSQLWIATHSIGMIKEAQKIEKTKPDSVIFLDFSERNYDDIEMMTPSKINKALHQKFIELTLGDFSNLETPEKIVFCEGDINGTKNKNFDSRIYTTIFQDKYSNVMFISLGSCIDVEDSDNKSVKIISEMMRETKILKFIDRDNRSETEITELNTQGVNVSKRRHLESYLYDDEILEKLCNSLEKTELLQACLDIKNKAIADSIARGNPKDDLKSPSGQIFTEIKKILPLTQAGNTAKVFERDTLAPLVKEDTLVYQELETEMFN